MSLLVVPTLVAHDVILGMDVMSVLGVHIDTKQRRARPTILPTSVRVEQTRKIPERTSVMLAIRNPFPSNANVIYEPSEKLPPALRSVCSLNQGEEIKVRIENTGEETIILDPVWEIGTVEAVEIPEKMERIEEKEKTPEVPNELEEQQRRQLKELLDKYKRIFSETMGKLGRAGIIKHEIYTRGQPI